MPANVLRIACFGDVVGRPGRDALVRLLPSLRTELGLDLVIANVENSAHGYGVTPEVISELTAAGVDVCTSGNHIWKNAKGTAWLAAEDPKHVLRPANYGPIGPGRSWARVQVGEVSVVIINLIGEAFMKDEVRSPFAVVDQLLEQEVTSADIVVVDFHAEATGEKRVLGWHLDGRASLLVGTHTHVPTADAQIMPQGLGYVTDLGMTGATDSSLGMDKQLAARKVIQKETVSLEPPQAPSEAIVSGVVCDIDPDTKRCIAIERIDRLVPISYTESTRQVE